MKVGKLTDEIVASFVLGGRRGIFSKQCLELIESEERSVLTLGLRSTA